jgi:DNA-binding response OmpR family regulator
MPAPRRVSPKVLMVDDNVELLAASARFLRKRGMEVITSDTPLGVRALILAHEPSVVVLDVMMPAMDGAHLAHMIQSSQAAAPALVLYSAMDEETLRPMALLLRRTSYVCKTDGLEALFKAVCAAGQAA